MAPVSDLVPLSELEVHFSPDSQLTRHIYFASIPGRRRVRREDHWKRQRELGRGGFGAVYLEQCVQGDHQGTVRAVKEIQRSTGSNYNRELEAIAFFSHSKYEDHFVKSFGWYSTDDKIFITFEYLKHGDLQQYLGTPLPEREGQHLVHQMVEGLSFMHDEGFAHRDLKPANILVVRTAPEWWVKIADFGISKRATEGLTVLRTQIGTPAFAAPEVLGLGHLDDDDDDDGTYTHAVDIWSTGVITFLILTGETIFRETRRLRQYAGGRLNFPVDTLLTRSVSDSGCKFTESCMAPRPQNRPGTKELLQHPWFSNLDSSDSSRTERSLDVENLSQTAQPRPESFSSTLLSSPEEDLTPYARGGNYLGPSAAWSDNGQDSRITAQLQSESMPLNGELSQDWQSDGTVSTSQKSISYEQVVAVPTAPLVPNSDEQLQIHWTKVRMLEGHTGRVGGVAFSPDGRLVASCSVDKTIRLWNTGTGREVKRLEGHRNTVRAVAFSSDGHLVASCSNDDTVSLWSVGTGQKVRSLKGHTQGVGGVAFSLDGRLVASCSIDRTIRLWDTRTGRELKRLEGHTNVVGGVAFSPDGRLVASCSIDKTVRLWDTETGREVKVLEGHTNPVWGMALSPDGRLVASCSIDKTVRLWDTETGREVKRLKGHTNTVGGVAFSPDGRLVASCSLDTTVRLWDTGTGREVKRLEGHTADVMAVAFSPDGQLVASSSDDQTVRLWDWRTVIEADRTDSTLLGRITKLFS